MATNPEIRTGLATRFRTIVDLQVYEYPPGSIVTPAAIIRRRNTNYDVTFDGADDTTWGLTVFVPFSNTEAGAASLDDYVSTTGDKSVAAALQADPTLGAVVDYSRVVSAEGERVTSYAGINYLSVEFNLEIGD